MGNAGIGAQKDNKMRIQIVCSILAEVQNELKEGQKPGDATKVQAMAQKDDIVIIAGKGHENYQILGKVKHHFDDKEIAQEFLNNK